MSGLLKVSNVKVIENTAYYLLNKYVRKGNQKLRNRIFIVHRLDRDTSGIIVFAKNENANITILHPYTKEEMTFETKVPPYFKSLVRS